MRRDIPFLLLCFLLIFAENMLVSKFYLERQNRPWRRPEYFNVYSFRDLHFKTCQYSTPLNKGKYLPSRPQSESQPLVQTRSSSLCFRCYPGDTEGRHFARIHLWWSFRNVSINRPVPSKLPRLTVLRMMSALHVRSQYWSYYEPLTVLILQPAHSSYASAKHPTWKQASRN